MAHLVFIAKNRDLASFQLTGPAMLGRSVECDVYVPDVFVSRHHCRFEKAPEGWVVIDQRSRNGLFYNGRRVYRRMLNQGDIIEIGTFSVQFHQGDIPSNLSTMTPFGEGTTIASLMDTLFTGGLRPAEYLVKSKRKPAWVRAQEEAAAAQRRLEEEEQAAAFAAAERLNFSDGAELDIELQLKRQAQDLMPAYVLVSRELLSRFSELAEGTPFTGAQPSSAADESFVAGEVGLPQGSQSSDPFAPLDQAAAAVPGPLAMGPRGPSGSVKNLWEEVYAEVQKPASGTKGKAAKEGKPAEKKEKASRPAVEYRPPMGERFKDWLEWAKTVDVSFNGMVTAVRDKPKHSLAAALVLVLVFGGWGVKAAVTPKYKPFDTSHMSSEQKKAYDLARLQSQDRN